MKTWILRASVFPLACLVTLSGGRAGAEPVSGPIFPNTAPGYWLLTGAGSTYAFNAPNFSDQLQSITQSPCTNTGGLPPESPSCVGIAATANGQGYWIADGEHDSVGGKVIYSGAALPQGNTGSCNYPAGPPAYQNARTIGIAAAPTGAWLVSTDGGVFALCGAPFFGSMGGTPLDAPVVGMAATPGGGGYWLVAADGGVFAFGDARYRGSMGGKPLDAPIVGMAATRDGGGYWLVAADGGVFTFGDATFSGSMVGKGLDAPVVGMAANRDGTGYWLAGADGGVFAFGGAPFLGSAVGQPPNPLLAAAPFVGITSR